MKTKISFLLISLMGFIALAACSATSGSNSVPGTLPTRTVNVNGYGEVFVQMIHIRVLTRVTSQISIH